ncbi:MAG: hypothetical protein ACOCTM_00325 [Bacteroidota bacterium]
MNHSIIAIIISFFVFTGYLLYVAFRYGITQSISKSYYKLKGKWLFTIVLWGFSIPLMIAAAKPLMFFAGAGICFTGAAPSTSVRMEARWHIGSSVAGIVLGTFGMWIHYGMWWIPAVQAAFTLFLVFFKVKNYTWWIETLAFYLILAGIFIENQL